MQRCKIQKYRPVAISDTDPIENILWKALKRTSRPRTKGHYAVLICGNLAYDYAVSHVDSHFKARGVVLQAHAKLGLASPEVSSIIGMCRRKKCTCGNAIFAFHNERDTPTDPWRNSEHYLFAFRAELLALFCPVKVRKHVPLWRAKRTSKG